MRSHVVAFAGLLMALAPLAGAYPWQACNVTGSNFTANSTYQENLRIVAATLPGDVSTSPGQFATATAGAAPNKVYALAFCPVDQDTPANASACRACVAGGFQDAQKLCPYNRGVFIFYNLCIFSFSNQDFLASTTNSDNQEVQLYNSQNITSDVGQFNRATSELLNATAEYTANSASKFATGAINFDATYPKIYSMAWCTPDLTPGRCRECLAATVAEMASVFIPNTQGARIAGARCSMRFEVYPFYNGTGMVQLTAGTPAALPGTPGKKSNKTGRIVAIVLPIAAAILASTMICFYCWRRRTIKRSLSYASHTEDISSIESLIIDLPTLRTATCNFAENNKLGEGGFGAVYKGSLPSGQEIAVKRLSQSSGQGIGELKNELALIAKLQHKNLVRLVGVCLEEEEKLLIYEYMPNRSLDTFIFDSEKCKELDLEKRFMIIKGIARGLQYLHEDSQLKIVHRDLKASNVLLDADMNPKISDFGLARLFGGDQSQDITNRVVGTYGYMAPEYALRGHYSIKSDIYSFGVLLLEIITGRTNSDSYNSDQCVDLLSLIWEHWTMKTITEMIDPSLRRDSLRDEILRCIHIGLMCVQEDPVDRPTMSMINVMFDSSTIPSQAPSRPAFYEEMSGGNIVSSMYSQPRAGVESMVMSPNEVSITDPEPR